VLDRDHAPEPVTGDKRKKRLFRAAHKEARVGGKISGKAMQDEFWACAKTLVVEKSKNFG
jgi:hypothetical protein